MRVRSLTALSLAVLIAVPMTSANAVSESRASSGGSPSDWSTIHVRTSCAPTSDLRATVHVTESGNYAMTATRTGVPNGTRWNVQFSESSRQGGTGAAASVLARHGRVGTHTTLPSDIESPTFSVSISRNGSDKPGCFVDVFVGNASRADRIHLTGGTMNRIAVAGAQAMNGRTSGPLQIGFPGPKGATWKVKVAKQTGDTTVQTTKHMRAQRDGLVRSHYSLPGDDPADALRLTMWSPKGTRSVLAATIERS